jgi:hypothetical protein
VEMSGQRSHRLGVFVGSVVVQNQVQVDPGRGRWLDGFEELESLLVTVTRSPFSQNLSAQVIQRCKQGHGAVSVIVVSASSHMALAQRQSGLGSLQGLALAFFITAKDDRSGWRIQIQSDDIPEFGLELRIVGELESTGAMGLRSLAAQIRCTAEWERPLCRAMVRQLYRTRPLGGRTTSLSTV